MAIYKVVSPVIQGGVVLLSGIIELNDEQAERLVQAGAIEVELVQEDKELNDMSLPELKEFAKLNDIDLDGATKKENILLKIKSIQL
ncbi:hypothetical protein MH117_05040 [Paenibacillus sp. ACRRX]|uniref:hypothetical protein n=1 Tax=Paenibacillus sp. ACRRX TaxID=2918206 RepID=UPI001EF4B1D6|nr:hypothetical protein [Paenibacillus sp. ACRRX]MCG7406776.1 hypothetical protein [Paenibacillus sp. ACRRX]